MNSESKRPRCACGMMALDASSRCNCEGKTTPGLAMVAGQNIAAGVVFVTYVSLLFGSAAVIGIGLVIASPIIWVNKVWGQRAIDWLNKPECNHSNMK